MGEYVSTFGVRRYVGKGEGRDSKYDASVKPSLGLYKSVEIVMNANGPVPNLGEAGYDGTQPAIPAGSTVTYAYIVGGENSASATVTVNLVNKKGGNPLALFTSASVEAKKTTEVAEGAAALKQLAEDVYAHATGLVEGLDAKLIIEYI